MKFTVTHNNQVVADCVGLHEARESAADAVASGPSVHTFWHSQDGSVQAWRAHDEDGNVVNAVTIWREKDVRNA